MNVWREILGALYIDAEFVFEYDTSRQIINDIALYSKALRVEAEVNRIAQGVQNVVDKGQEVTDKGNDIIDKLRDSVGCKTTVGSVSVILCLLAAAIILMRYKK